MPCPNCEDPLDPTEITRDNYSRKQLEKSVIYCHNKLNGCPAEMKLKDSDKHLEDCKFQKMECLFKSQGCTAVLLRGQLAEHLSNECHFRMVTCEYCGEDFPNADLEVIVIV